MERLDMRGSCESGLEYVVKAFLLRSLVFAARLHTLFLILNLRDANINGPRQIISRRANGKST
jgi:hypothetical protein